MLTALQYVTLLVTSEYVEWDHILQSAKEEGHTEQELEKEADFLCQAAGMVSSYLMVRGSAGVGDQGHKEAMKFAHSTRVEIRKALGYNVQ